jgi:hypothetical protein
MVSEYETRVLQAEINRKAEVHTFDKEDAMVGHEERQKLLRAYDKEPSARIGMVLKCAVCLLILAGLAAIGITSGVQSEAPASLQAAVESGRHGELAASVETTKGQDERRVRFEGTSVIPQAHAER